MNILGAEQKKLYEDGISETELERRKRTYLDLYYSYRKKDESSLIGRLSLNQRKHLHPLILLIYMLKNRLGGYKYNVIYDKRQVTDKPIIYAVTHVGKFDIEVVSEVIKEHYYLLSGDYEHIQGIIDAPFLFINGVIYFNETVAEDRNQAKQKMINLLQKGGNLLYFPEGTWNLSENLPVLPCYWGIVEIAKKGNAVIIPIGAEQYGKCFDICVGENIDLRSYGSTPEEKSRAIRHIRDVLATLKWDIWESRPTIAHNKINPNEWDEYLEQRFREWTYFDLSYVDTLVYRPKNTTAPKDAFSHLYQLKPNINNLFLFNQRLSGYSLYSAK